MIFSYLLLVFVSVLFLSKPAYAYLDPGSGSYIIQIVIATLFGAMFAVKSFWIKIKIFFQNLKKSKRDHD